MEAPAPGQSEVLSAGFRESAVWLASKVFKKYLVIKMRVNSIDYHEALPLRYGGRNSKNGTLHNIGQSPEFFFSPH